MDFKNRKAAVSLWQNLPPSLEVEELPMASPSPFWKPHALVCPRSHVFIADRYHVYELCENNTVVRRYPCAVNGTIADVAAVCDSKACWPVVLLQAIPPQVLDCSTGRQSPLLQTNSLAGRIATNADGSDRFKNGQLRTLFATMDKMIVQYGWSVQLGAWEPLWDIEDTVGVLAMDLVNEKLLVFHRGGFVQVQNIETGQLCSTWALDSSNAVIGGGCGNQDYSSILVLVKKGHGTALLRAKLPSLDECNKKDTLALKPIEPGAPGAPVVPVESGAPVVPVAALSAVPAVRAAKWCFMNPFGFLMKTLCKISKQHPWRCQ